MKQKYRKWDRFINTCSGRRLQLSQMARSVRAYIAFIYAVRLSDRRNKDAWHRHYWIKRKIV